MIGELGYDIIAQGPYWAPLCAYFSVWNAQFHTSSISFMIQYSLWDVTSRSGSKSLSAQCSVLLLSYEHKSVADPGFSKWGGAVLSQMGGAHILFSGKKCIKLKEIGLKWGAHVF